MGEVAATGQSNSIGSRGRTQGNQVKRWTHPDVAVLDVAAPAVAALDVAVWMSLSRQLPSLRAQRSNPLAVALPRGDCRVAALQAMTVNRSLLAMAVNRLNVR